MVIDGFIMEHIKDINLGLLANELGYSRVYTGKLVKQLTGFKFPEYIHDLRCKIAADLLKNSDVSINEIITSVGYENGTFFRKKFKDKYRVNPLEYRKE